jgi:hypothetical protein
MEIIEDMLRQFANEIEIVVRQQVADAVTQITKGVGKGKPSTPRTKLLLRSRTAGKRSPELMEKQRGALLNYIEKNPGQRSEQIAKATGITTHDLALPIRQLIREKKIKAKGVARGTTYTAS